MFSPCTVIGGYSIIYSLLDFDWYKQFFKNVPLDRNHNSCIVHNGVVCGEGTLLVGSYPHAPGIILLKDKYRPVLGMSRNEVREMPLDALCDMATIWNTAHAQNYLKNTYPTFIQLAKPFELSFECMKTVLEKRKDIEEKIILKTNKGNFRIHELSEKLHETDEQYILKIGSICHSNSILALKDIYQLMIRYYIQEKYLIRAKKRWLSDAEMFDDEICIIDSLNARAPKRLCKSE